MNDVAVLMKSIDQFAAEREWDQFHSPKNLSMALTAEAGELAALFQWLTEDESQRLPPEKLQKVTDEIADVLIYALRLCSKLRVNPLEAATNKIRKNTEKYPVALSKGTAKKYSDLK